MKYDMYDFGFLVLFGGIGILFIAIAYYIIFKL